MTAWEDLLKLARACDTVGAVRLVTELDEAGRKAIATELPRYVTRQSRSAPWWEWPRARMPLMAAGIACMSGAAAVSAWLLRREFRWASGSGQEEHVLGLLRRRPAEWQADVARRIAARLRLPDLAHWEVAAAIVRETGAEPPQEDAFMVGWLRELDPATAAGDPLFAAYGPRIFEIDGLGATNLWPVVEAVVRLTGDGLLDRAAVIDGLVRRLLRDGSAALIPLAGLHDRLDPDLDEAAARARDYARLLPAGPTAVADMALAQLRRLEEAGRLEEELFTESVAALAFRPEKKLLRAAVSWAGDAVLRDARRVDDVLAALAMIFVQDTLALQERAVRLAVKVAPQAGEPGREAVRQAAVELPAELREKISAAYGGGLAELAELAALAEEQAPAAAPLAAGRASRLPPPIASPDELARAIAGFGWPPDPYEFERLLAGLAEWSHREPAALREALRPWWRSLSHGDYGHYGGELREGIAEGLRQAFLAFAAPERSKALSRKAGPKHRRPGALDVLDRLYLSRALELVPHFEEGGGYPVLLATPTAGTGHIDPGVLIDRLQQLEAAGVAALPADLAQALLRLPREVSGADARRAETLTSEAGRSCAAWMRGGGPADPEVRVSMGKGPGWYAYDLRIAIEPPAADLPEPIRRLFGPRSGYSYTLDWWPLVLPSHRELVAAHLAAHLPQTMESRDRQVEVLASLVHGEGALGAATAHALVCGMGHMSAAGRAAATDALLTLAARGEVPAAALGEAVTQLAGAGLLKLNRVVAVLEDATQAGAHEAVWALITHILPGLLPKEGERPRPGVADLLAAGARAARIGRVRADLPEVAAVAARKGSSRLVQEARRLRHLVSAP
ncbi:DUF6493 family protein [Nonomuraea zeae]|uniref:DUF7824 domain-containing protein n=1 Tax=Nonomuraea zeae TaxID=1642303 RepID=A0A5S4F9A2_9ACTN|nr:DUF6493 family protein [Nonomuraea zeae]TMR13489.1 hypothetical protein ETD85_57620 [Nonomuraea zeae]